jgi:hypothetical protein
VTRRSTYASAPWTRIFNIIAYAARHRLIPTTAFLPMRIGFAEASHLEEQSIKAPPPPGQPERGLM